MKSRFGNPEPISEEDRRRELPGREPFIIPPAATKSSYYQYPYTRELWRTAFDALRSAERVSLVGYSLPPEDLVMGGMIEGALGGSGVEVDVVNLDPDELSVRVRNLTVGEVTPFSGEGCVEAFTHAYRDRVGADFARDLAALDPDDYRGTALLVRKHNSGVGQTDSRVSEVVTSEAGVVLVANTTPNVMVDLTAVEWDADGQPIGDTSPRLSDLITEAQSANRLIVRRDGLDETVIGSSYESRATGVSNKWITFNTV